MQSLTLLQNKIKRNPKAYGPEFRQQMRSFEAQLSIFSLSPPSDTREFGQLVAFLSQTSYLFPNDSEAFAQSVLELLEKSYEAMNPELRRTLLLSLQLLRNRGQLQPLPLISLCFSLFRCQDKALRELLYSHVVNDVRLVNKASNNNALNKAIQNTVYSMLDEPNSIAAKKSLQVMVELYKRRVWTDTRTVNVIAKACLSEQPKNVAIALQFFLGIDDKIDSLEEEEAAEAVTESLEASTGKTKVKVEKGADKSAQQNS